MFRSVLETTAMILRLFPFPVSKVPSPSLNVDYGGS